MSTRAAITDPIDRIARRGVPILMYHRVTPDEMRDTRGPREVIDALRVSPEAFRSQMAWLSEAGFQTITLDDLLAADERSLPRDQLYLHSTTAIRTSQTMQRRSSLSSASPHTCFWWRIWSGRRLTGMLSSLGCVFQCSTGTPRDDWSRKDFTAKRTRSHTNVWRASPQMSFVGRSLRAGNGYVANLVGTLFTSPIRMARSMTLLCEWSENRAIGPPARSSEGLPRIGTINFSYLESAYTTATRYLTSSVRS
jgi:hypothetical protein